MQDNKGDPYCYPKLAENSLERFGITDNGNIGLKNYTATQSNLINRVRKKKFKNNERHLIDFLVPLNLCDFVLTLVEPLKGVH